MPVKCYTVGSNLIPGDFSFFFGYRKRTIPTDEILNSISVKSIPKLKLFQKKEDAVAYAKLIGSYETENLRGCTGTASFEYMPAVFTVFVTDDSDGQFHKNKSSVDVLHDYYDDDKLRNQAKKYAKRQAEARSNFKDDPLLAKHFKNDNFNENDCYKSEYNSLVQANKNKFSDFINQNCKEFVDQQFSYQEIENKPNRIVIYEAELPNNDRTTFTIRKVPTTYHQTFHDNVKSDHQIINDTIQLFKDYYEPKWGLFLTLHWDRHHHPLAKNIVLKIEELKASENPEKAVYQYLFDQRNAFLAKDGINKEGSFARRIDFALEKLRADIENDSQHQPSISFMAWTKSNH